MSLSFVVSFSTLFLLVLISTFGAHILVAFLLGQSAALCPNSSHYPQCPLNVFMGFFLLDWLVEKA